MEIFTFVYMGGSVERVTFVPLTQQLQTTESGKVDRTSSGERQLQRDELLKAFSTFDASQAQCSNPEDLDRLLGIIETACGSLDAFSLIMRKTFEQRAKASFASYASEKVKKPRRSSVTMWMRGGASGNGEHGPSIVEERVRDEVSVV